eukprot:scaffold155545_cov23-Tisochrysis_lutea.AAC.1
MKSTGRSLMGSNAAYPENTTASGQSLSVPEAEATSSKNSNSKGGGKEDDGTTSEGSSSGVPILGVWLHGLEA